MMIYALILSAVGFGFCLGAIAVGGPGLRVRLRWALEDAEYWRRSYYRVIERRPTDRDLDDADWWKEEA